MSKEIIGLVDSHAHLDMEEFDADRDQVVERAFEVGIQAILCPADLTSPKSILTTLGLVERHQRIVAAAGVHPHQAKFFNSDCVRRLRELASEQKILAAGEIGLDFHHNFSSPPEQRDVFRSQLRLAQELALPVIIHSRNAGNEIIAAVQEEQFTRGGVLHCFNENWDVAKKMMEHNFFISFSGILTFPKAHHLREVAPKIPLEKLLVETDSPYLAPVSYRGTHKRNEPASVVETAKILAELKNVSLRDLATLTTKNFFSLFPKASFFMKG
jgi:TatD DNase family protein